MTYILNSVSGRYAIALAAMLVALLGAGALAPFAGGYVAYIVLAPSLALTALCCGLGPSVLATTIALFGVRYWFVSPSHSLGIPDTPQSIALLAFFLASSVIVALGERSRRSQEGLRESQKDLEAQVEERTAELDTANRGLGDLTARLLHLQDEERRRIARELHDSVGQSLAALSMNLSSLGGDIERIAKSASIVADSAALVNEMSTDIRTISYLLHPPLLDEAGLASALRWYIQGFTERSGIKVALKLAEDFDRLPRDLETAIFRLVQECLTNIHRHSESPIATIGIARSESEVRVEVADQGKGIPPEKKSGLLSEGTPGVGIRGMRERLRQLGGTLEIDSNRNGKGTIVVARLPVAIDRANVVAMAGGTSTY
jgi:signal transduction histidine kinase